MQKKGKLLLGIGKLVCSTLILILMLIPCISFGVFDAREGMSPWHFALKVIDLEDDPEVNYLSFDSIDELPIGNRLSVVELAIRFFISFWNIALTHYDPPLFFLFFVFLSMTLCVLSFVLALVFFIQNLISLIRLALSAATAEPDDTLPPKDHGIGRAISPLLIAYISFVFLRIFLTIGYQDYQSHWNNTFDQDHIIIAFNMPLHFGIAAIVLLAAYTVYEQLIISSGFISSDVIKLTTLKSDFKEKFETFLRRTAKCIKTPFVRFAQFVSPFFHFILPFDRGTYTKKKAIWVSLGCIVFAVLLCFGGLYLDELLVTVPDNSVGFQLENISVSENPADTDSYLKTFAANAVAATHNHTGTFICELSYEGDNGKEIPSVGVSSPSTTMPHLLQILIRLVIGFVLILLIKKTSYSYQIGMGTSSRKSKIAFAVFAVFAFLLFFVRICWNEYMMWPTLLLISVVFSDSMLIAFCVYLFRAAKFKAGQTVLLTAAVPLLNYALSFGLLSLPLFFRSNINLGANLIKWIPDSPIWVIIQGWGPFDYSGTRSFSGFDVLQICDFLPSPIFLICFVALFAFFLITVYLRTNHIAAPMLAIAVYLSSYVSVVSNLIYGSPRLWTATYAVALAGPVLFFLVGIIMLIGMIRRKRITGEDRCEYISIDEYISE